MVAVPDPIHTVAHAIYEWHEATSDQAHRAHLGASVIGHECKRFLWLTFRWAKSPRYDGRMLRLFGTGHREEARLIEELRAIGCDVEAERDGKQISVRFARGHGGGSVDGIINQGVPHAPKARHVLECKTMGTKTFKALLKSDVENAQPRHYAQMQVYMRLLDIGRALYLAVCKETDEIYSERVYLEEDVADKIIARAADVIDSPEPPPPLASSDAWPCKGCTFSELCHGRSMPEVNCRTCAHSSPVDGGEWHCARHNDRIPIEYQRFGCSDHRYLPPLLHWATPSAADNDANWIEYMFAGQTFRNGPKGPGSYPSHELAAAEPGILGDVNVDVLRILFDGEIEG